MAKSEGAASPLRQPCRGTGLSCGFDTRAFKEAVNDCAVFEPATLTVEAAAAVGMPRTLLKS